MTGATALRSLLERFARPETVATDPALRAALRAAGFDTSSDEGASLPCHCLAVRLDPGADLDALIARYRDELTERGRLLLFRPLEAAPTHTLALRVAVQDLVLALCRHGFALLAETWSALDGHPHVAVVARRDEIALRPATQGDDPRVEALSQQVFHVSRAPALWRWKYAHHPLRAQTRSVAHDDDGSLAAHYGAVPVRLLHSPSSHVSRTLEALQYCDIMTAARVRTKGRGRTAVISRAIRHLYAAFAEQRVDFGFGFNTATSRAMAVRFHGGTELEKVGCWHRPVENTPRPLPGRRIRVASIERFDRRFDSFFERVAPAYRLLGWRDQRHLTWRYLDRPDVRYHVLAAWRWRRLIGWAVFRRIDDRLVWGDGLLDPRYPEAGPALLEAALSGDTARGATSVETWAPERPQFWCTMLERAGFERVPEPNDLSIVYGAQRDEAIGDILPDWFYTMGDSDLF